MTPTSLAQRDNKPFPARLALFAAIPAFLFFTLVSSPRFAWEAVLGLAAIAILLRYPEFALALYVVIGDIKGDNRIASAVPFDLTLGVGVILCAGVLLNLLRRRRPLPVPSLYLLFIPFVAWMLASLAYTPVLAAGAEKLARFLTVTGIVIIAPFFVLTDLQAMKRFLIGFAGGAFAICAYSLTGLGGEERLASPSDNTIGLGHVACSLFLVFWFLLLARFPFPRRLAIYPLLAVPAVALIGSGSRGPAIALFVIVLLSLYFHRRLILDLGLFCLLGGFAVPFVGLPQASLDYLGSLFGCRNFAEVVSSRADLASFAWDLLRRHPLLGVGLEGYRFHSLNAGVYKWPHNIFLEVACELGIPALLLLCAIFLGAVRAALRLLGERNPPFPLLSQLAAALLVMGIINATNTGDINSDRLTWLFVTLVFVVAGLSTREKLISSFTFAPLRKVPVLNPASAIPSGDFR
ncbi:MAG TPA: O-antigen ligase family protein [Candidatus Micrarchaeaceae archaeon]|nr:O-antigen ligase family protein [Candidatus Micrarchaeaceae archaeon]